MGEPFFSIITPVYDTPDDVLRATIDSVTTQTFGNWEWVLVDDCSPSEHVLEILGSASISDQRIRLVRRTENGGISTASNDAVAAARGRYLVLLDHDDLLTEHALETMADAIALQPDADYLYSDEDKVDSKGNLFDEFRKPDWSPERFRSQMYTCHLSVLRTQVVREVGGFDSTFNGSQDHDLVFKVTERARRIVHIPEILYHWRVLPGSAALSPNEKPYAWDAGRRAVQAHLDRLNISAAAEFGPVPGVYSLARPLLVDHRVSIVIPTRGTVGRVWGEDRCFVLEAVRSALKYTAHSNVEIVVVYDEETPAQILNELREILPTSDLLLVPYEGKFNYSLKCNLGVLQSTGDSIVLLNDDVEVIKQGWLESLVAPLLEPDVGLTGARLLYSDGTIQHGGHIYTDSNYYHVYRGFPRESPGHFSDLLVSRECSGVTAACAAVRRDVFDEVGGLAEGLPANFNDVDFSMKVSYAGYRILWLPQVELFHFESKTREARVFQDEVNFIQERWGVPARGGDRFLPTAPNSI